MKCETYDEIVSAGYAAVDVSTRWQRIFGVHRYVRGLEQNDAARDAILATGFHPVEITSFLDNKRRFVSYQCPECPHNEEVR